MKNQINIYIIIAFLCTSVLSAQENIEYSNLVGESKGEFYNIPEPVRSKSILDYSIRSISISYDKFIRRINYTYFTGERYTNNNQLVTKGYTIGDGCNNCERFNYSFEEGEYIVRIEGRSGALIDRITFFTNKGKQIGPFGGSGGQPFTIAPPANSRIVGFYGSAKPAVNQIGIKFVKESSAKIKAWEKYENVMTYQAPNSSKIKRETQKKKFTTPWKNTLLRARKMERD